jgi:UDP-glucose 4-epimerase
VGQTINLGSGAEISINDLARAIALVAGRPDAAVHHDTPRPGDVRRLCADMSVARARLGYNPSTTLDEGLRRLLAWYRAQAVPADRLLEDEIVHNWTAR